MIRGEYHMKSGRIRAKISKLAKDKAERITQAIVNYCIQHSPVYTGSYRASWHVSERKPEYIVTNGGAPGTPLSAPTVTVKATMEFPEFHVTNGQPYSMMIENGWSQTQAPAGVVRLAIASVRGMK